MPIPNYANPMQYAGAQAVAPMQQNAGAQPMQMQQPVQAQIIPLFQITAAWVPSQEAAEKFYVEPNRTAILINMNENVFYIKKADNLGKPLPLQPYEYKSLIPPVPVPEKIDISAFVSRADFKAFESRFDDLEEKISRIFDNVTAPKKKTRKEETDDAE